MSLAIFDLDNTLIAGDSDFLWGQFLVEQGIVDGEHYERNNSKFYQDYNAGTLDIDEYLAFALKPLADHDYQQLLEWRIKFVDTRIKPLLLPKAKRRIDWHKNKGDTVLIITATNQFVTEPSAELYGVDHLLATKPEFIDGQFTGKVEGTPCYQDGKIVNLDLWLSDGRENLACESWFYSDSMNDIPLLKQVDYAVAVDADQSLIEKAEQEGWLLTSFR
ncbi:MAG: HAD-IB family hydrolase [Gammaproteobacteria bacterium]|nr:HAD-IB family hydrolase [Gammaproteobacteria bacterium]